MNQILWKLLCVHLIELSMRLKINISKRFFFLHLFSLLWLLFSVKPHNIYSLHVWHIWMFFLARGKFVLKIIFIPFQFTSVLSSTCDWTNSWLQSDWNWLIVGNWKRLKGLKIFSPIFLVHLTHLNGLFPHKCVRWTGKTGLEDFSLFRSKSIVFNLAVVICPFIHSFIYVHFTGK